MKMIICVCIDDNIIIAIEKLCCAPEKLFGTNDNIISCK